MHYMGGKSRLSKRLAKIIESYRTPHQTYLEPFCGALSVTEKITGQRTASDSNKALITLFTALQGGWQLPEWIDKQEYDQLKATQDPNDPKTALAGIIYSFSGAWFQGYVTNIQRKEAQIVTLMRKIDNCLTVNFQHCDYRDHNPVNQIIYCDPPYASTNGYVGVNQFDSVAFWDVMRDWSKNNTVLISEYAAPDDFKCILSVDLYTQFSCNRKKAAVEKLWIHNSYRPTALFDWH